MITGTVVLNLSHDSETADRRAIGGLYGIPSGARVVLRVGERDFAPPWTVDHLREYDNSLHFDVQGSAGAVTAWVKALRGEEYVRWGWPA